MLLWVHLLINPYFFRSSGGFQQKSFTHMFELLTVVCYDQTMTRPSESMLLIGIPCKINTLKYSILEWDELITWSKRSSLKRADASERLKYAGPCQDHFPSRWQTKLCSSTINREETPQENMLKNTLQPCCGHRYLTFTSSSTYNCTPYHLKVNAKLIFSASHFICKYTSHTHTQAQTFR